MSIEYREFRAEKPQEAEGKLYGQAAPFNSETLIGNPAHGGWREVIAPGTFSKALREGDTVLLCDHNMAKPLARHSAGTLRLSEDAKGLQFDADPVDTTYARDMAANVKAGNKGGMSIGFEPVKDEWYDDKGKPSDRYSGTKRILREVKLPELSIVTLPAYGKTSVNARDALLAEREARAADTPIETHDALVDMATRLAVADSGLSVGERAEVRAWIVRELEFRASPVSTKARKSAAAKGEALPDGSYPIKDKAHLHAAAVLAASHHGNWKAAKKLIRKMAKKLGVPLASLPGFGDKKNRDDSGEDGEIRIKPSSKKRVLQADAELKQAISLFTDIDKLPPDAQKAVALITSAAEHVEHITHKEKLNGDDLSRTSRSQEPETSTPDQGDGIALRLSLRSREIAASSEA